MQEIINAVISLCGLHARSVKWESYDEMLEKQKSGMDCEGINLLDYVINIIKQTIEKFCEMGTIAANGGGSLVNILNLSWKGVVTLLQLGDGILAAKMNITDIILMLISLVNESLRCTSKALNSSMKDTVSVAEARRMFVPVKFYLINAVKICSLYPKKAYLIYRDLVFCILMISNFRISMSNEKLLRTASEVFTELLERPSFDLLNSILISDQVKQELKFEILDSLFIHDYNTISAVGYLDNSSDTSTNNIYFVSCQILPGKRAVLFGRIALFLSFLRYSVDFEEDAKLGITRKLGWLLDVLVDEEVYSSVLVLQIPVSHGSGTTVGVIWQPMISSLLNAMETFLVVASSSLAWVEVESFLFENIFHPHFLCGEIVMELWCFLMRHAESGMLNEIVKKLCSLLKILASPESVLNPCSALRKLARFINMLLTFGAQSIEDQILNSTLGDQSSELSSIMLLALFVEGFPLNVLSDKMRHTVTQRVLTDYSVFVDSFDDKSTRARNCGAFGVPVFALSASLQLL